MMTTALPHTSWHQRFTDLRALHDDLLDAVQHMATRGDLIHFPLPPQTYLVNDPALVYDVLATQSTRVEHASKTRSVLRLLLGEGLLISRDMPRGDPQHPPLHQRQRTLLQPAFTARQVAHYAPLMQRQVASLVMPLRPVSDLVVAMNDLALRNVHEALFGAIDAATFATINAAIATINAFIVADRFALFPRDLRLPMPGNRRYRAALETLNRSVYGIIAERRRTPTTQPDVLATLLATDTQGRPLMSDEQIRDEAVTLILSGHATSAEALTWFWWHVLRHPDVYARLQQEVDIVLAGTLPAANTVPHLPYLDQVLKETMRLHPPAYMLDRQTVTPMQLGHYTLPVGATLMICPYTLHRTSAVFADPERFDPERFTPERATLIPRGAYLPFGAGPRQCIGQHFAQLVIKLALATLLQRVTYTVRSTQLVPEPTITLLPRGHLVVQVTPREDVRP